MSLENAPQDKVFWLKGGTPLKNLYELAQRLRGMDHETFSHHVTGSKNDFASWVRHVIHDEGLARKLSILSTQEDMEQIVIARIQELESHQIQPIVKQKKARASTARQPPHAKTISDAKNKTALQVSTPAPKIIVHENTTPLKLTTKHERIITPHVSQLKLTHDDEPLHNTTFLITMNVILGVVVGVGLTVLILTLL